MIQAIEASSVHPSGWSLWLRGLVGWADSSRFEAVGIVTQKRSRSVAVWPDNIRVGNVVGKNESSDDHDSPEAAHAVCRMLERHGFGGEGKVFPVSTRVEPID